MTWVGEREGGEEREGGVRGSEREMMGRSESVNWEWLG